MTERIAETEQTRFDDAVANADSWESIDNLVRLCDDAGFWEDEFLASTTLRAKKARVRRLIKGRRDAEGIPNWASIEKKDESGKTVRVYKQEVLFDVDDYRQVVRYYGKRSSYYASMARSFAKRCKKRFNVRLQSTFDLNGQN